VSLKRHPTSTALHLHPTFTLLHKRVQSRTTNTEQSSIFNFCNMSAFSNSDIHICFFCALHQQAGNAHTTHHEHSHRPYLSP
jgi:hypothetical protein